MTEDFLSRFLALLKATAGWSSCGGSGKESLPQAQAGARPVVVLSETWLRARELERACGHPEKIKFLARSEWLRSLYFRVPKNVLIENLAQEKGSVPRPLPTLLQPEERPSVLINILQQENEEFPNLYEELLSRRSNYRAFSAFLNHLQGLMESFRLSRLGAEENRERFPRRISNLLDEWGNVLSGRERAEEELGLFLRYEAYLESENRLDFPAVLLLLKDLLTNAQVAQGTSWEFLPSSIVLDSPWLPSRLEAQLFQALSEQTQVLLLPHPSGAAASGHLAPLFPETVSESAAQSSVAQLAQALRNESWLEEAPDLLAGGSGEVSYDIWLASDVEKEIEAVSLSLKAALSAGKAPEDFQVFASDLEMYRPFFEAASRKLQIPFVINKPQALSNFSAGRLLLGLLDFLENPSLRSLSSLVSHGGYRLPEVKEAEFSSFLATATTPGTSSGPWESLSETQKQRILSASGSPGAISHHRCLELLAEFNARFGYAEQEYLNSEAAPGIFRHLFSLSEKEPEAWDCLLGLFLFAQELEARNQIFQGEVSFESVFGFLKSRRRRLKEFLRWGNPGREVASFRALRLLQKEARRQLRILQMGSEMSSEADSKLIFQALRQAIDVTRIQPPETKARERRRGAAGIAVSEFLEARAAYAPFVFVCGCLSGVFPSKAPAADHFLHETEAFRERLLLHDGGLRREEEGRHILSGLLLSAKELVLSFPKREHARGLDKASEPSEELLFLAGLPLSRRKLETLIPQPPPPDLPINSARQERAIASRRSASWTPYDGDLSSLGEHMSEFLPRTFSVSELEDAADCRHRIFFRKFLDLKEAESSFFSSLKSDLGSMLHSALAVFFSEKCRDPNDLRTNFSRLCRELHEICEENLHSSPRRWKSNVYERYSQNRLLDGLLSSEEIEVGAAQKAGMLHAALRFQRDLIDSFPKYVEFKMQFSVPVGEGEGESIEIRATADRIDESDADPNRPYSIWDYKTGKPPPVLAQIKGLSLQNPLYAEALRQRLTPHTLPRRGGFIHLSKPNRTGDDLVHPSHGVVLERLALKKVGQSNAYDESAVESQVEASLSKVRELYQSFKKGDFRQQIGTEACSFCGFRSICSRSEIVLEQKLSGIGQRFEREATSTRLVTRSHRNSAGVERFFWSLPSSTLQLPSEEQIQASDISKTVSLRAGAGSGKTFVLRTRVIQHLLEGSPLESILAITFTEDAAREIRSRIRRGILTALREKSFLGKALSEEQRGYLRKAAAEFQKAQIGTIHSFAARLVSLAPDLAGLSFFEEMLLGDERTDLLDATIQEIESANSGVEEAFEALLREGLEPTELRKQLKGFIAEPRNFDLVLETVRRESQQGNFLPILRREHARSMAQLEAGLLEFLSPWTAELSAWISSGAASRVLSEEELRLLQDCRGFVEDFYETLSNRTGAPEIPLWVEKFFVLEQYLQNEKSLSKKMGTKSKYPRNFWKDIRDRLEDAKKQVAPLARPLTIDGLGLPLVLHLASVVLEGRKVFRRKKDELAVVDFQDLIAGSLRLLEPVEGIAEARRQRVLERVRSSVTHLLIDEFQDTDPEQWRLLRELFFEAKTLFLVGDAQQAIYGFRGGDVRVFDAASKYLQQSGGQALTLQDNYRSHPEIIEFCNRFFEKLFAVDFLVDGSPRVGAAIQAQELRARKKAEGERGFPRVSYLPEPKLEVKEDAVEKTSAEKKPKGKANKKQNEAIAVADFIQEVLEDLSTGAGRFPGLETVAQKRGGEAPLIAVLCHKRKDLGVIRSALEAKGIAFQMAKNSGFYELEEISCLKLLLRTLIHPEDLIALVGLLRSAVVGLSDAELLLLHNRLQPQGLKAFWQAEQLDPELQHLKTLLLEASGAIRTKKVSEVLRELLENLAFTQAFLNQDLPGALTNIEVFLEQIEAKEARFSGGASAAEVLRWVEMLDEESAPASALSHESKVGVVLSTIHAAKGLEYPMVILPYLITKAPRCTDFLIGEVNLAGASESSAHLLGIRVEDSENDFVRAKTLVQYLIEEAAEGRAANEARRLFYVACTRAEEYLVFSRSKPASDADSAEDTLGTTAISDACFSSRSPQVWLDHLASL